MKSSFCVVIWFEYAVIQISQAVLGVENPSANIGRLKRHRFDPWIGRSPGGEHGYLLQYSCWEIPMREEPGGLQSKGLHRVRHDWVTKHAHTCARYAFFIHIFSLNQYCHYKLLHVCATHVHAKLLQLCLTLCDPVDCSLPGFSVHRIL